MTQPSGSILNQRYRIESPIAQGGFGTIYRAWDINLNTQVAIKENINTSSASSSQFTFEAQLLAKLRHENLPYVIDHFTIPGQGQYLVMEFIKGEDLQTILRSRGEPFSENEAKRYITQISAAVAYLHTQVPPIIHRDIKPANIKITPDGKVMLVDFGIAKVYQPTRHTTIGAKAITQGYSPPEQYGEGLTDKRSDIYSLGATFYTLVTGHVPVESVQRHMGVVFLSPREINSRISQKTEEIILKAMALNPAERFQSANDLCTALSESESIARAINTGDQSPPTVRVPSKSTLHQPDAARKEIVSNNHPAQQVFRLPIRGNNQPKLSLTGVLLLISMCLVGAVVFGGMFYFLVKMPRQAPSPNASRFLALTETESARIIEVARATAAYQASVSPAGSQETPGQTARPTDIPSPTSTPLPRPTWMACANTYPSRLNVGDRAFVSQDPPLANRVRALPGPDSEVLGYLDVAEKIEILEGPVCSANSIWWKVRSLEKYMLGWTAEGDADNYWLVPLP